MRPPWPAAPGGRRGRLHDAASERASRRGDDRDTMPQWLLWTLGLVSTAAVTTTHGQKRVMVWTTDDAANTK
jgi:hypothetical protein